MHRLLLLGCLVAGNLAAAEPGSLTRRWVYLQTNLLVDANLAKAEAMLARAAAAGYNGVVVTDSKFCRWDGLPAAYAAHVAQFAAACRRLKLAVIPCVFPMGWSNDLLGRAPDLAAGLPVIDAPFIVRAGHLVPEPEPGLANAGFEIAKGPAPAGWNFVDLPGRISVLDHDVHCEGTVSLRMQDIGTNDPQWGHGRAMQQVHVRRFAAYHVGVQVRTRGFTAANAVRIAVLAPDGAALSFATPPVRPDQDWTPLDIVFNSLDHDTVNIYLGIWGGKAGTIWWDDVRLEPAGLVNVLRRPGAPLRIRTADGRELQEGRDVEAVRDPLLGQVPWPGGYTAWHAPPQPRVLPAAQLAEGARVVLGWYHPMIVNDGSVAADMAAPELAPLLEWQAQQVQAHLAPDGWFMAHDEIRTQGWDADCAGRTPGAILAANAKLCTGILARLAPPRPVYVWSDMFDPAHNAAATGPYYLAKGDGPWSGSWEGLAPAVTVVNWNADPAKRRDSLAHFAKRGHHQILAGYYDADPTAIRGWLADAADVPGVDGVMYTTWADRYDDLERFAQAAWGR